MVFKRFIKRSSKDLNTDITNYKFISHSISAIIYIQGFGIAIYFVPFLKSLANSLLAGVGIVTIAVCFASQQALSNIVSGVFIILFKPYRVNDRLTVQGTMSGIVEDISLRHITAYIKISKIITFCYNFDLKPLSTGKFAFDKCHNSK